MKAIGSSEPSGRRSLGQPEQLLDEQRLQALGHEVHLLRRHRHEAPVLLPGLVVDLADLRQVLRRGSPFETLRTTTSGSRLRKRSATRDRRASGFSSSGNQYASRSFALRKPCALEEPDVVARVVGHHQDGRRVEPLDEQARLVVQRRVGRAAQHRHLALARPTRRRPRAAAPATSGSFVDSKKPKNTIFSPWNSLWLRSRIAAIAADVLAAPARRRRAASRRAGRTGSRRRRPWRVVAQGRDPVRVVRVDPVGDVEEAGQLGLRTADPLDRKRRRRGAQRSVPSRPGPTQAMAVWTSPTSRPTFSIASSARDEVLARVRGHERRADQRAARRRRRREDAVDEDALLLEAVDHRAAPSGPRPTTIGTTGVSDSPVSRPSERRPSAKKRVFSQRRSRRSGSRSMMSTRRQGRRDGGRRRRRREDQRAGAVLDVVDDRRRRRR